MLEFYEIYDTPRQADSSTLVFRYLLVMGDVDNDGVTLGDRINLPLGSDITDLADNPGVWPLLDVPSTAGIKVNLPPVGFDDAGTAKEMGGTSNAAHGHKAVGNVLDNDTDNENDPLAVTAVRLGDVENSGTAGTLGQPLEGLYGSLVLNADGSYVYRIDQRNPLVDRLNEGDTLTEYFNYTLTDGSSFDRAILTITIVGSTDAPVVTNVEVDREGEVVEKTNAVAGIAVASGQLSASDVDLGATQHWSVVGVPNTVYGDITVDPVTGKWTYVLDNSKDATKRLADGESVVVRYVVRVTDDFGAYVDQIVSIRIFGKNDTIVSQTVVITASTGGPAGSESIDNEELKRGARGKASALGQIATPARFTRPVSDNPLQTHAPDPQQNSVLTDNAIQLPKTNEGGLRNTLTPPDAVVGANGKVSYSLPEGTFMGGQGLVRLQATQKDGSPLPSWVSFDGATGKINAQVPSNLTKPIEIKVEARDSKGGKAETVFKIKPGVDKLRLVGKQSLTAQIQNAIRLRA